PLFQCSTARGRIRFWKNSRSSSSRASRSRGRMPSTPSMSARERHCSMVATSLILVTCEPPFLSGLVRPQNLRPTSPLLRCHPDRAIHSNCFAVEVVVLGDHEHELAELGGPRETLRER